MESESNVVEMEARHWYTPLWPVLGMKRCPEVTREVWDRRDKAHVAHSWARNRRSSSRMLEEEKTVRAGTYTGLE